MVWERAMGMIQSKIRIKRTPSILRCCLLSSFIPVLFLKLIHQVTNFIFDLTCIPLDEQNPEREEKPDDQKNAQEDNHCNGDSKRKFLKDLFNIPFCSHSTPPFLIRDTKPETYPVGDQVIRKSEGRIPGYQDVRKIRDKALKPDGLTSAI